jgi:CheY-like chemotaxis protein
MYFPRSHDAEGLAPPPPSGPVQGGSETILVVEDDPAVRGTVVEMLGSLGYRVLKADNAAEALGIVKSGLPIDLLFTDVVMPGPLRSPELARQAKALHPGLAVLFTSGYTQDAIVHGGRLDPGVELLSKPYGREQLAHKIRHLLADRAPASRVRRIVVAEDNHDLLEMSCSLFEALGQDARGAASVAEAETLLALGPADLLFTDIDLAGQSGVALARRMRSAYPDLAIVFASGFGAPEARELDFPFDAVAKPYRLDDLRALLLRLPAAPSRCTSIDAGAPFA